MKEEFKKIIEAYGWDTIASSNPLMDSYINPHKKGQRINYYFTSGTLTYQDNGAIEVIRKATESDLEDILIKGNASVV